MNAPIRRRKRPHRTLLATLFILVAATGCASLDQAVNAEENTAQATSADDARRARDNLLREIVLWPSTYRNAWRVPAAENFTLAARTAPAQEPEIGWSAAVLGTEFLIDKSPKYQAWISNLSPYAEAYEDRSVLYSIGGNEVSNDKIFDQVVALSGQPGAYCSGVLVARNLVITAGHCLCSPLKHVWVGSNTSRAIHRDEVVENGSWMPDGASCNNPTTFHGRDIALIQLRNKVPSTAVSSVARFVTTEVLNHADAEHSNMYIVGFGTRSNQELTFGAKNFVLSPIISLRCDSPDDAIFGCVSGQEIVGVDWRLIEGRNYGIGPCHGDSGGAVFINIDDPTTSKIDKKLYLIGVVSRLIDSADKCGDGAIFSLLHEARILELKAAAETLLGSPVTFAMLENLDFRTKVEFIEIEF